MDRHSFQLGETKNADVKLLIICSDGLEYDGNPVCFHSEVLKKSKFLEARLSERWSSYADEIKLTVALNSYAENYMKCIRLMYSSYSGKHLSFSSVDETLDILPVASELLFEEGIQACMQYLEAVPWTSQQKLKIKALLSSLHVKIPADLSARLEIPRLWFSGELELLKKELPEMFSIIWRNERRMIPASHIRCTMKEYLTGNFHGNASSAMQEVCRDAHLSECRIKIKGINYGSSIQMRDSVCEEFLWLLDLIEICNKEIFVTALIMFVEDSQLSYILGEHRTGKYDSFSYHLLEILVDRYLKALSNGDISTPKSFRISFLKMWIPVIAYLILGTAYSFDDTLTSLSLKYANKFVEGVTKVVGTIPFDEQKSLLKSFGDSSQRFETRKKETFQWWIKVIWLAASSVHSKSLGTE